MTKKYSISKLKILRYQTGAKLIDIKDALEITNNNLEQALKLIRIKNLKKSLIRKNLNNKEGLILGSIKNSSGCLIELTCESDFVTKSEKFISLGKQLLNNILKIKSNDINHLLSSKYNDSQCVKDKLNYCSSMFGEKIQIRRIVYLEGKKLAYYAHCTCLSLPPRIGVLAKFSELNNNQQLKHKSDNLAKKYNINDIVMHIAASSPQYINIEDIPKDIIQYERSLASEFAKNKSKVDSIKKRITDNFLQIFFQKNVLMKQKFIKNNDLQISDVMNLLKIKIDSFTRFEVGD